MVGGTVPCNPSLVLLSVRRGPARKKQPLVGSRATGVRVTNMQPQPFPSAQDSALQACGMAKQPAGPASQRRAGDRLPTGGPTAGRWAHCPVRLQGPSSCLPAAPLQPSIYFFLVTPWLLPRRPAQHARGQPPLTTRLSSCQLAEMQCPLDPHRQPQPVPALLKPAAPPPTHTHSPAHASAPRVPHLWSSCAGHGP